MSLESQVIIFRYSIGLPTFKKQVTQNGRTVQKELLSSKQYLVHFLSMRQKFLELRNDYTLPYLFAGSRILKCELIPQFVPKVADAKDRWLKYRDTWLEKYPEFVEAESSASRPADTFPDVDHLRGAFSFRVGFSPLPGEKGIESLDASDSIKGMLHEDFALQKEETINHIKRSSAEAIQERVNNIEKVLSRNGQTRISEKLTPSLIKECKRIATVSPIIDSRLATIIETIESTLNVPGDTLRKNKARRAACLMSAKNINGSLKEYIKAMQ